MAAIDPATLPAWSHHDVKTEKTTILSCLLGRHGKRELTGPFGRAMLFYETLRHNKKLVELVTKLRRAPDNDQWRYDPDFTTLFTSEIGFIASTPGFPDRPFLAVEEKDRAELVELFTPGQPALEIADIEKLEAMGVLERFKQLAKLAKEGRQHKKPGQRFKQPAILKLEKLNPGESIYVAIPIIRAHMGIEAVRKGFGQWLKDNRKLFAEVDTIAVRSILQDLAILRLVKLYGYPGAGKWTREHRPKESDPPRKTKYEPYFGERGTPKDRPIFRDAIQYENAVKSALKEINAR